MSSWDTIVGPAQLYSVGQSIGVGGRMVTKQRDTGGSFWTGGSVSSPSGAGTGYVGFGRSGQAKPPPAIIPAIAPVAAAAGLSLPGWLMAALGVAGAGYGIYQALGGGEGGGLFGNNLLGGPGGSIDGIPLGGPGLAEPPAAMVAKEWSTGTAQFYQLIDGRIAVYSKKKKRWKVYRPAKHIVVPRNPRIGTLIRADKRTDRLIASLAARATKSVKKVTMIKG